MRIVQFKSILSWNSCVTSVLQIFKQVIEQVHACIECLSKLLLFEAQYFYNTVALQSQLDVVTSHQVNYSIGCLSEKGFIQS